MDEKFKNELDHLKKLAGISLGSGGAGPHGQKADDSGQDSPLTYAGTERAQYAREHNIKPGTDEWFQLWFARQRLTGEDPMPKEKEKPPL